MQKKTFKELLRANQTVFTFNEIAFLLGSDNEQSLKSKMYYYVKKGDLYRIRKGLYSKNKNYSHNELATKIYNPSYISFETALSSANIIFQYYGKTIFIASYTSKAIQCDECTYIYRSLKPTILTNSAGIEIKENYSIATPERAFLDTLYINTEYHFDNLNPLNWDKVQEIAAIYQNKSLEKRVRKYHEAYQREFTGQYSSTQKKE